jgi:hypothetical protein
MGPLMKKYGFQPLVQTTERSGKKTAGTKGDKKSLGTDNHPQTTCWSSSATPILNFPHSLPGVAPYPQISQASG